MFKAEIVADSLSPHNHRITSQLITFPRYILAEFNTHRALSRNSASSRAIPFERMVKMVKENPFVPMKWMLDHKGMQGTEYLSDKLISYAKYDWLKGRDKAIEIATDLHQNDITKQMINRLLEPFMWHTVLVTATEWENFFALRDDPAADIHMQYIAHLMLEAMNTSNPKRLKSGEWHMPFGDDINGDLLFDEWMVNYDSPIDENQEELIELQLKIATARCARTSYLTLGESPIKHDYAKDIKLHDDLDKAGHMSPFEHCARAMTTHEYCLNINGRCSTDMLVEDDYIIAPVTAEGWCGNFRGFIQYRKQFPNENRSDSRLIKHTY